MQAPIRSPGIKAIGIRDEQSTANAAEFIFAYPTDLPPEKEVFSNPIVAEFLFNQYHVDFMDIRRTAKDHHYYADKISHQCDIDIPTIEVQCIQAYLENQKIEKFSSLLNAIRGTS